MHSIHAVSPNDFRRYDTQELRRNFLLDGLFPQGELALRYVHNDRMIIGGAVPSTEGLVLAAPEMTATDGFLDRREVAILSIGGKATVEVGGESYSLERRDCLYVGKGGGEVVMKSNDPADPARLYLVSAPAHRSCPTAKIAIEESEAIELGSPAEGNRRTLVKMIHPDGVESCQLMLGVTTLHEGSMWNTMPPHRHERRTEAYLYFDLDPDQRVVHLMGPPSETRHLIVSDGEVVVSPPWSIHAGAGTAAYSFCWAMAGENQEFDDMEFLKVSDLL